MRFQTMPLPALGGLLVKSRWELRSGARTDTIDVTPDQVVVGKDEGQGGSCYGVGVSLAEFLAGKLNPEVEDRFGSVLAAVREVVVAGLKAALNRRIGWRHTRWRPVERHAALHAD